MSRISLKEETITRVKTAVVRVIIDIGNIEETRIVFVQRVTIRFVAGTSIDIVSLAGVILVSPTNTIR